MYYLVSYDRMHRTWYQPTFSLSGSLVTLRDRSGGTSCAYAVVIVHLPVPKINSPGGAYTASGEYTELRSVA